MTYGSNKIKRQSKGLYKALALLLCFATLITSVHFGIVAIIAKAAEGSHSIQFGGKNIDSIVLPQDDKRTVSVEEQADTAYSWQLCIDKSNDEWVTVSGQKRNFLTLSYAMVGSLSDSHGTAYLRSVMKSGGNTSISSPVCINVSYTAPEAAGQSETVTVKNSLKSKSLIRRANAASSDFKSHTVTVNYVYANGDLVSDPYVANIADGEQFSTTVHFPSVVGYLAYFGNNTDSSTEYEINIDKVTQDVTYTVTYKPTLVSYKVHHYVQNILDDNYVLNSTTTQQGLTASSVGEKCAIDIDGFTVLYYDKDVKIAADGSTEIDIYYDRNYYLLSFDLGGGYGVEPIYTRYGATVSVSDPTRPGYLFDGWELIECGGATATDTQKDQYNLNNGNVTLPSMNLKYRAKWKTANTTFTVVYWTENADDDGYSYNSKETVNAESGTVVNGSTYNKTIEHFTYNADKTDKDIIVEGDGSTVVNVYYTRNKYTLTFSGVRDGDIICGKKEHTHTYDGSYTTGFWIFQKTYFYGGCYPPGSGSGSSGSGGAVKGEETCGQEEHTHNDSCYGYSVTAKYGADIHNTFPIKDGDKTIWWQVPRGTETFVAGNNIGSIDTMPGENITFTKNDSESGAVIYYYIESISGTSGEHVYNGKNYNLYKKIDLTKSGYLTYKEEFHNIKGFEQGDSNPTFENERATIQTSNYLYYTRKSYNLSFYNLNADVSDKSRTVQYEAPLATYEFVPDYPESLEPNAYEFAGWFTTPECFDGTKVDFSTAVMPDSDVTLYAKWAPKTHTVRVFKTADMTDTDLIDTQTVSHGHYAKAPTEISNGNYVFNGWFYMDGTEKKAFDFNNIPVNRSLDIFAEWSSKTAVLYTVRYELADGTEIAEPTVGSTLAGTSKTFTAKGGTELYDGYREGFFPNTNSHTILMNIDGGNEYTFIYTQKESVPYTVRYLEKGTETVLAEEKQVTDNRKSVVTEVFNQIPNYMPDAYQKRLVLSADENENVLTFWYTKDETHAYYIITHWVQNLAGDGYTEYRTIQGPETINKTITETPLSITGYTYNSSKSKASGNLTADGLELNLYYDRNLYGYTVKYLEYGTNKKLKEPSVFGADNRYGTVVSADAADIRGYTVVGEKTKTRTISDKSNEIIFYYSEQEVTIKYVPIGLGSVSIGSETVKAATGSVSGSVPTPASGYRFDGWFADEGCTTPVSDQWVGENQKLTPQQADGLFGSATYYAKFSKNTASLTIQKDGWDTADENQTYLFRIVGTDENTKSIDLTVTVHENGKTTITDLPIGNYTVTEKSDWSWRYTPVNESTTVSLPADGMTIDYKNTRSEEKWLDGDSYKNNIFN